MHVGNRRHMRDLTGPRPFASALQLAFVLGAVIGSLALIANWSGTPGPIVEWLCGIGAILLIVVTVVKSRY